MSEDINSIFDIPTEPAEKSSFWKTQAKYFAHGFLWWLVNVIGFFIFPTLLGFLVKIGYIIGLVIGLAIVLLSTGFINWMISQSLWFEMKEMTLLGLLGHGLLLSVSVLSVDILIALVPIYLTDNNLYVTAATLIWTCYVNGYLSRFVARIWSWQ